MNIYVYGKGLITAKFKGKMKKKPQKNNLKWTWHSHLKKNKKYVIVYLMHSKQ